MHGTLKQRTKQRENHYHAGEWAGLVAAVSLRIYTSERPHEALAMKTPAEVYTTDKSAPLPEQPAANGEYNGGEVRRLDNQGGFSKYGYGIFVCER